MSKIYVLHENSEWTIHLTRWLDRLGFPYEEWHLDKGHIDLASIPPEGIFYNRISASSHTREHRYAPEFTKAVIAWLERHGRTVVNGSRALNLEISKVEQYMALNVHGINTPKTLAAVGKDDILSAAKKLGSTPFITKHNRAGKGQGVYLFDDITSLENYLYSEAFDEPVDGITLIQEYINAPEPFIIRHEFINGKFLYGVKVDTSKGFELCPADACSIEDMVCPAGQPSTGDGVQESASPKFEILKDHRPDFIPRFERFLRESNINVAGIEVIWDESGNYYAYDVNTNTNYNSDAENAADIFAMEHLAKYLESLRAGE